MNAYKIAPYLGGFRVFAYDERTWESFNITGRCTKAEAESIVELLNSGLLGDAAIRADEMGVIWIS